ncbi:Adenylate and Guanylate cyclase catalytic domain [Trypanosoma vivax]|uniref:adenylate cyclase n=1 Tax=Trypanosoma vivax (strain Y486) TaxID=1055687 RepID=F9WNJ3_TRYVY|nr:Adenylate and Guanylate cyclase catalytic domain [Trypanosoma vivax]CCD19111.1 receptor-type adenylate cyclase GRESAG, putative [Trypanosoma vivax Y486]|eukprot:CCD19111.1 receptor-type adenylate cyclase GRESAG, putative [Trypanosoma vivax Y486]
MRATPYCVRWPPKDRTALNAPGKRSAACNATYGWLSMLTVVLLLSPCVLVHAEENVTVRLISLMYHKNIEGMARLIHTGLNASLMDRRSLLGKGINLQLVEPTNMELPAEETLKAAISHSKNVIDVVIGPVDAYETIKCLPLLMEHKIVAFGPITASTESHLWAPNLYIMDAEPAAEVAALIRYAVNFLRVRRISFMYMEGLYGGENNYNTAKELMVRIGYESWGVFSVPSSLKQFISNSEFDVLWEKFASSRPQAVIMLSPIELNSMRFIWKMVADPLTSSAYLLTVSSAELFISFMWKAALESVGVPFVPGRVITTGKAPLAKDTDYLAIRRFQEDMRIYMSAENLTSTLGSPESIFQHGTYGQLTIFGWIAGEVLLRTLRSREWLTSREAFMKSLYDQRRYVIDDLVFGDFGGECVGEAAAHGAMCRCNHGGSMVYMRQLDSNDEMNTIVDAEMSLPKESCNINPVTMRAPLVGVVFAPIDRPVVLRTMDALNTGVQSMIDAAKSRASNRLFVQNILTTAHQAVEHLKEEQQERIVTAVFGVIPDAMLAVPDVVFIDPLTIVPRLNRGQRNVIHLSPTVEQQFFVLSMYLGRAAAGDVHTVIRSTEGEEMVEVLERSLATFGVPLASAAVLGVEEPLVSQLPAAGDVFVVGLSGADVSAIAQHLEAHGGVRVLVLFSELAMLYNEFVAAFSEGSAAARLVFATSLPHWDTDVLQSRTIRRYRKSVPAPMYAAPLPLMSFVTTRLLQIILTYSRKMNPEELQHYFYYHSVINVDDMRYGPFNDRECAGAPGGEAVGCAVNYGATGIAVWSMARALDVSVAPLSDPVTPSMVYADPNAGRLTLPQVLGVASGSVVALLLLCALLFLLHRFLRSARDNGNAPTEPTAPVTLVFTDIESSTALWAACPELMPDAVAAHHRLIRSLIVRHRCYEVKTIGDSFMIACRSPSAAVQLVRDLQQQFLAHQWGTKAIDESYREFEEQRAAEDEEYVPPTARLEPEVYRQLWSGLRVRAGVHTGLCDIRHDEVTKGYDYYGGTSNMAARTESVAHGGQVLLTRAAYMALTADERARLDVTPLGAVPLRGVPEPVEMYQLNAVPGRTFAALRLDRFVELQGDAGSETASTDGTASKRSLSSVAAQEIASSLSALLSVCSPSKRQELLTVYCQCWRVELPSGMDSTWNDDGLRDVLLRVSAKAGRVASHSRGNGESSSIVHSQRRISADLSVASDSAVHPFVSIGSEKEGGAPAH